MSEASSIPAYRDPAGQRGSERFSLLLRTAKLLSQSGEYACIVRDVSETGTKLRVFHDLPPDHHMMLELANGVRYPLELVWHKGDFAGFRFASPIDVAAFAEERGEFARRAIRLRIAAAATFRIGERSGNARLINLSQQGACIELGERLAECQRLALNIESLPTLVAHVRWRSGFTHGLVFQQGFGFAELAAHAFTLQPFARENARTEGRALRFSA